MQKSELQASVKEPDAVPLNHSTVWCGVQALPLTCWAHMFFSLLLATAALTPITYFASINESGQTPLLFTIKKNRQMMVEFFIKNKANIHAVDDKGRTALMLAVEHKSTHIAELLLQCGVNVSASDNCGEIALSYAIASGNTASIKKSHSGDSLFAMLGGSYEAHIKNIPEKGGELIEASRQSMKDEVKYDTGNQKSGNLPDNSKPASRKKEVLETTLVQPPSRTVGLRRAGGLQPPSCVGSGQAVASGRVISSRPVAWSVAGGQAVSSCPVMQQWVGCRRRASRQFKLYSGPAVCWTTISQILPQNSVGHSFGDAHQREKDGINGHTEASRDSSRKGLGKLKEKTVKLETHIDMTSEEEHKSFDDAQCTQSQVSPIDGTENKLLHKYHKKKDEVSMKRLGIDTVKYQNQEKKCFENTEILREKNTSLPWTQKLNEETLMEIFQDNEQLGIWKVESTLQNFTPESEKQSTERTETDVKSHPARSGPAPPNHGESPTPKRNLELAFQRGRDKDFSSQEKNNIDVSNLNGSSQISSQQIPKSKVKTSDLENELHQTRVMTLATDQVNRHLKQRQCQLKEMEHRYQNEERKRNEHLRKQEASKEKVSKLQRETTLREDQLHDYQNKGENKIGEIINVQTQFYDVIKNFKLRMTDIVSCWKTNICN
ncbi:putative ankyrin repeat domain-containing protein 20A3 [Marmota flaviventris]|uniref:putative ankyrin repeat domain-containing protein 20A3 n=1 Tax=Marmota flaviventris TaxID=93162 RepID=UPI003A8C46B8